MLLDFAEKNAYAVSVLRRVRLKLEGRDINGSRYCSAPDHIFTIRVHILHFETQEDMLYAGKYKIIETSSNLSA